MFFTNFIQKVIHEFLFKVIVKNYHAPSQLLMNKKVGAFYSLAQQGNHDFPTELPFHVIYQKVHNYTFFQVHNGENDDKKFITGVLLDSIESNRTMNDMGREMKTLIIHLIAFLQATVLYWGPHHFGNFKKTFGMLIRRCSIRKFIFKPLRQMISSMISNAI